MLGISPDNSKGVVVLKKITILIISDRETPAGKDNLLLVEFASKTKTLRVWEKDHDILFVEEKIVSKEIMALLGDSGVLLHNEGLREDFERILRAVFRAGQQNPHIEIID